MNKTTHATVRLSLRELRELPYRAFRVVGASHGEALAAAEAVQWAELVEGTGLERAAASCRNGWKSAGLEIRRVSDDASDHSETVIFEVSSPNVDLLQLGSALIDLASSADLPGAVRVSAQSLDAGVDVPLRVTAARTGRTAFAAQRSDEGTAVRLATPGGDFGLAAIDSAVHIEAMPVELSVGETVLATTNADATAVLGDSPLRSAVELAVQRKYAAVNGVEVDAEAWNEILRFASGYKQPNKETST